MTKIVTLAEALAARAEQDKRSLLLGNGFSVACRPQIFRYDAIFDRFIKTLDDPDAQRIGHVFEAFATRDFEEVLRALKGLGAIAPYYGVTEKVIRAVDVDATRVRDSLVDALAASHPESPHALGSSEFEACAAFLRQFVSIYTLNYDLLLYWTVLNQDLAGLFRDGFGEPDFEGADYVEWQLGDELSANLIYLHGGLHLFASGSRVRKVSWCRTGKTLKEQIIGQMKDDRFPLFVAEGTADGKQQRGAHDQRAE